MSLIKNIEGLLDPILKVAALLERAYDLTDISLNKIEQTLHILLQPNCAASAICFRWLKTAKVRRYSYAHTKQVCSKYQSYRNNTDDSK